MESPNATFQQLKTPCVALNQACLSLQGRRGPPDLVISRLEILYKTLTNIAHDDLNPTLAEYVFIPLSYVLKASAQLPVRASEVTFACLALLLEYGWRAKVSGPFARQLLILLSITADRGNGTPGSSKTPSEDLLTSIYGCFGVIFQSLGQRPSGRSQLLESSFVPQLGHVLTVILDGLEATLSTSVQLAAVRALAELIACIQDQDVLASFLPGVVSGLVKVLTPTSKARRSWKVLAHSLSVFRSIIISTVADSTTRLIRQSTDDGHEHEGKGLSHSWLTATTGQLKLALANINRLHSYDRQEVRQGLAKLNLAILRECYHALENCRQLCLETLLVIESENTTTERGPVQVLIESQPGLASTLQNTLRDWTLSMPRILEGADEDKKSRRLKQLGTAYSTLSASGTEFRTAQQLLASSLPGFITSILRTTTKDKTAVSIAPMARLEDLPLAIQGERSVIFPDPVASVKHQADLLQVVSKELERFTSGQNRQQLAHSSVLALRDCEGDAQVAAMWLSLSLLKADSQTDEDALFNLDGDDESMSWKDEVLDDLYDFALSTLPSGDTDWRLLALSLEVIAMQSTALGQDFRNELVDALYPVLHLLGSDTPRLRQHAMVCLNIITASCGYDDVKDLIVSNADYLVNAIALKLNAYDVAPQGPQVLLLMVKLAGPSLVPYLVDTVDSIFAILEDYHGYTSLVELLFGVLGAIAEKGTEEPRLQIEAKPSEDYGSTAWAPTTVADLAASLRTRKDRHTIDDTTHSRTEHAPQQPWSDLTDSDSKPADADAKQSVHDIERSAAEADAPPKGETYPLLLRIATLTQHYLPSPSPRLRSSLLHLLADLLPSLAVHENSFLPLINTLWPEVVSRLEDGEAYVVEGALQVMRVMAITAGGFMKGRFEKVWPGMRHVEERIRKLCAAPIRRSARGTDRSPAWSAERRIAGGPVDNDVAESGGRAGKVGSSQELVPLGTVMQRSGYVEPGTRALWDALRALLVTLVKEVWVSDDMFEDVLRMLRPIGDLASEERGMLEQVNGDAVWLTGYREDRSALVVPDRLRESRWRWAGVTA